MKVTFNRVFVPKRCKDCFRDTIVDACKRVPGGVTLSSWYEGKLVGPVADTDLELLRNDLMSSGFELGLDRDAALVNQIERIIIEGVRTMDESSEPDLFMRLTDELPFQRNYLSRFYSKETGTTIQCFIIATKIRRVKELLVNEETITLTDIAFRLHFSSIAHLSKQFKVITGATPSEYRKRVEQNRIRSMENGKV